MNGLSAHTLLEPTGEPPPARLFGKRREIQEQQQQQQQSRSDPVASSSYVQRLNVQLPMTMKAEQESESSAGEDVLRLVIHVESDGDNYPEGVLGSVTSESKYHPLRRKISWHSEDSSQPTCRSGARRLLKQIGRQRSASLETPSTLRLLSVPVNNDDDSAGRRSVSSCPDEQVAQQQANRHHHRHFGSFSGSQHVVVKEFRRSSELLRNILLSLSSRRSSDSSANSNSNKESSTNLNLSGVPIMTTEAPDLQAALQAHRKRRWIPIHSVDTPGVTSPDQPPYYPSGIGGVRSSPNPSSNSSVAALFEAISTGNLMRTRQLLESGVDPNACQESGYTALHWCAVQTPVPWPLLLELLEHGCRVQKKDRDGTAPIFLIPNLPRIQQQLVNDAVDYIRKPSAEAEPEEESSHGTDGLGNSGGSSGVLHPQRAAGNLFRRFQQSAGARMKQPSVQGNSNPSQQASALSKHSKGSKDLEFPSECDSRNGFEITSIKVFLDSNLFHFIRKLD